MSDQSRGGWERLKAETGCNVTALMEAIGLLLDQGKKPLPDEVIDLAREIQTERDSRSP